MEKRSVQATRQAEYRQRKKAVLQLVVEVLTTAGLTREERDQIVIDGTDAIVKDTQDRTIIQVWNKKITSKQSKRLFKSTLKLEEDSSKLLGQATATKNLQRS